MIETKNVNKTFGQFYAVKDVSFDIGEGEIVGFLGQNGAGKTTLMRILTSYLPATSGDVTIAGFNIKKNPLAIRRKIGYLPETPPLYPSMNVGQFLKFAAELNDIPNKQQRVHIDRVLEQCDLKDVAHKTIAKLSKGYKQRVGIAQALINDPDILILDEPMNGLDPIQIQHVRKLIKNVEHKRTVILSTHILPEIEKMAERVLIINQGQLIKDANLEELLNQGQKLENLFMQSVNPTADAQAA